MGRTGGVAVDVVVVAGGVGGGGGSGRSVVGPVGHMSEPLGA